MQVPFVNPLLLDSTREFVSVIEDFLITFFGTDLMQGGDIPAIIIFCFTAMIILAVWRIVS